MKDIRGKKQKLNQLIRCLKKTGLALYFNHDKGVIDIEFKDEEIISTEKNLLDEKSLDKLNNNL
jgi:uncharacterized protein (UPF0128 family)